MSDLAHLEHAYLLWDPNAHYLIEILETIQRFTCKVIMKQWNIDSLSTVYDRRLLNIITLL